MASSENPKRTIQLKSPTIPILVVILAIVQLFFPNKAWMILFTGLGGAWFISYLWARSLKDGLRLERDMRFGWMQVGDQLQERITVENDGWLPGLWIRVVDRSDMQDYEISTVTDVDGRRYRHWFTRGICKQRGLFTLGPTSLEAGDPLGVYEVRVEYRESANMMVAPQLIPLPEIEIAAGGRIGEGRSHVRGIEQTVTAGGVREYIPGDSLRWIHWPTTARKNDPYVHLFDNEPSSDWWVVLDMDPRVHVGEGQRSTEEYGVILAASLVNRGLHQGKAVGFISHGEDLIWHTPDLGDTHLWKILRSLASVRPGGPPLAELLASIRSSLEPRISMVIITPSLSLSWLSAIELLQRRGIVPTVILLDPVSFGGQGNIQPIRDRLLRQGVKHYTISADLLGPADQEFEKPWDWWLLPTSRSRPSGSRGNRLWRVIARTARNWGLILLLFYSTVSTLGDTLRGVEDSYLWFLVGIGLSLGWLSATLLLPAWIFGFLGGALGFVLSLIRSGQLGNRVLVGLSQVLGYLTHQFRYLFLREDPPEVEGIQGWLADLWERLILLVDRLWMWALAVLKGESYYDPIAVTFLWGILLWGTAIWASWYTFRRKKPVVGMLPAIAVVAISMGYLDQISYYVVFMLGSLIALRVFIQHDIREQIWEDSRLFFDRTIRPKIILAASILALGLMVLSILSPSISIQSIKDFINDLNQTPSDGSIIARSIGFKPQTSSTELDVLDARRIEGLPNKHLLGAGPELSEEVVLLVQFEDWQDGDPITKEILHPPQRYLRNLTYDRYTGRGWESRDTEIIPYNAGEQSLPTWPAYYLSIRQKIQTLTEEGTLIHAMGIPISVDQDYRIAWRIKNDEHGIYDIFGATVDTDSYRVDSIVPTYSEAELREAGQSYPNWLQSRYMSLPASVPEEVLTLARQLTATEPTPYDRVLAIESYLRTFPYTLDVTVPPADRDVAAYFLFTLQEGYCDYYATSMAVLTRAAGMPARLVTGYVAETYDEDEGRYVVTADQAHAWVEVFFPGFGWIPFEPTAGRTAIQRPSERSLELPVESPLDLEPLIPEAIRTPHRWLRIMGWVLVAAIGLMGMAWLGWNWWLYLLPPHRLLPMLYQMLYRYERWIGLSNRLWETPYEFSALLMHTIDALAENFYGSEWLIAGVEGIERLTDAFVLLLFSPNGGSELNTKDIVQAYKLLRPRLWVTWLLMRAYRLPITWSLFWRRPPVVVVSIRKSET